jgi:hypothetical protein
MTPAKKRLLAAIFIMTLVFFTLIFGEDALDRIKIIVESGYLSLVLWAYVIGSVLMHTFIVIRPKKDVYGFFEKYSNTIYSIGTFGFGGGTSIALLKGIFLQHFYDVEFFKGFSGFDFISMLILTSFLLIYCVLNCTKQLSEAIFYTSASDMSVTKEKHNESSQQDAANSASA